MQALVPQLEKSGRHIKVVKIFDESFESILLKQRNAQQALIDGQDCDTLFCCQHEPVLTLGRGSDARHVLSSQSELNSAGVKIVNIERGGQVTYHGPGQLVFYPIINLNNKRRDVGWYMRTLEQVVIDALGELCLECQRIAGKTGVWISRSGENERKIASVGVRISRWRTLHGFAVNITKQSLQGFRHINPCGLVGAEITCLENELALTREKTPSVEDSCEIFIRSFVKNFAYERWIL